MKNPTPSTDTAAIPLLRNCLVVGQHFLPDESKAAVAALQPEEKLTLHHEADNEHDPYAVRVRRAGVAVGFLPATLSAMVVLAMNSGMQLQAVVAFVKVNKAGNFTITLDATP